MRSLLGAAALAAALTSGLGAAVLMPASPPERVDAVPLTEAEVTPAAGTSLQGRVIVLDPGHQLGNGRFPDQVNRPVDAGGFDKPCNTTGTSTRGGFAEATFAWRVAVLVKRRLEDRGAQVLLTRGANRRDQWGPCVDERGRLGNALADGRRADLKLSIHGDGCDGCGAGFHVIAPESRPGWTDDVAEPSLAFAAQVRAALRASGLPFAPYVAGGDGLDVRGDLGTLNWSDVPVAMVELGNMRSRADARRMTSKAGQRRYADALVAAVVATLP